MMIRVFSTDNRLVAWNIKNILHDNGMASFVKNDQFSGAAGEIPPVSCPCEVWLFDDGMQLEARRLIEQLEVQNTGSDWECPACGEKLEPQFEVCWNCGQNRLLEKPPLDT